MHCARLASKLTVAGLIAILSVPSHAAANINVEARAGISDYGVTLIINNFGASLFLVAIAVLGELHFTRGEAGGTADASSPVVSVVLTGIQGLPGL